jgi:threonine aldolase
VDRPIDLRSDTVTKPTAAMRSAMARADVGDDVMREDPTVRRLEERAAELTGKDHALFVPSGTMANLIAILVHTPRRSEILADERAHVVLSEVAGHAGLAGVAARTLRSDRRARFRASQITAAIRDPGNILQPRTALVMLENTHAHRSGQALDSRATSAVAAIARRHGVRVHVDGARIFNASIATGERVAQLLATADSASFCLSKGLGCPVGSLLAGDHAFIEEARRIRALLGGGLRQVGIIAAAGLVALSDGPDGTVERLVDDHRRAKRLAEGLGDLPGFSLDPGLVSTNLVISELRPRGRRAAGASAARLQRIVLDELARDGVAMLAYPRGAIRAATHMGIDDRAIDRALIACTRVSREFLS